MDALKELFDPRRHLLAIASGVFGGALPFEKPGPVKYTLCAVLAIIIVKLFYGDLDKGFQLTWKDLPFYVVIGGEGAFGAWLMR
jgi:hypothetical protein